MLYQIKVSPIQGKIYHSHKILKNQLSKATWEFWLPDKHIMSQLFKIILLYDRKTQNMC